MREKWPLIPQWHSGKQTLALWHIHTARSRDRGRYRELMGSNILYRNVHTGLAMGNEPDPLSSIMLAPFPVPVPVPVQCSVNEPLETLLIQIARIANNYTFILATEIAVVLRPLWFSYSFSSST